VTVPIGAAEIGAALAASPPTERLAMATAILDRIDRAVAVDPARFSAASCDALAAHAPNAAGGDPLAWLNERPGTPAALPESGRPRYGTPVR